MVVLPDAKASQEPAVGTDEAAVDELVRDAEDDEELATADDEDELAPADEEPLVRAELEAGTVIVVDLTEAI